ncbi:sulfotransferase domain-containing protein [Acuticoccus mangrovi]|uniref:Sulfotransferase domain-containing protein n=1 Tax=Acuticoccus mangrovi TaxID=2796142 RepID=A0A934MEC1_9HYPH|nr:sulfotransferase domain-containing protein [Acuticoccus mangrovi]MBJ3777327.1 sulfotransferase domain-containing protein [Acuticoccus mangrovi]
MSMPTKNTALATDTPPKPTGYSHTYSLKYASCVSWPRSGHHLLVRLLSAAFGDSFQYCEYYKAQQEPGHDCCGSFPCTKPGISMSKQHDFDLKHDLPRDARLIVQFRKFLPAVVSEYELYCNKRPAEHDTKASFIRYARGRAKEYPIFIHKWVRTPRSNRVVIDYDDLMQSPSEQLNRVAKFYGVDLTAVDLDEILNSARHISFKSGKAAVHQATGVKNRRDYKNFRYYDEKLFGLLQKESENYPE